MTAKFLFSPKPRTLRIQKGSVINWKAETFSVSSVELDEDHRAERNIRKELVFECTGLGQDKPLGLPLCLYAVI